MMTSVPHGDVRPEQPIPHPEEPFVSFDLPFEIARLQAETGYEAEGHAGRTLTKAPELRVVLEAMKAGTRLPLHGTPERVTLQVMIGQLRVWLEHGDNYDLAEGCFVSVEAGRVDEIECLDECAFLLTLSWPPARRGDGDGDGDGSPA
jgi:quercetin dioxygenase-like cupin family protein